MSGLLGGRDPPQPASARANPLGRHHGGGGAPGRPRGDPCRERAAASLRLQPRQHPAQVGEGPVHRRRGRRGRRDRRGHGAPGARPDPGRVRAAAGRLRPLRGARRQDPRRSTTTWRTSRATSSMRWDFDHGDVDAAAAEADGDRRGHVLGPARRHPAPDRDPRHRSPRSTRDGHLTDVDPVPHGRSCTARSWPRRSGSTGARSRSSSLRWAETSGGKIDIDPHDFISALLARAASAGPVKIVMSREEEFVGTRTRQPIHFTLRTGRPAPTGTLLFRDAEIVSDNGAYDVLGIARPRTS